MDLILADFQLPNFSGLEAIALARVKVPQVPVIIISGSLGDEMAAECIKQGAADYLLKDKLVRLGPAVSRVLESSRLRAERRKAERALHRQQAELRALIDLIPAYVWFKDTKNVILHVNQRAADAAGKRVDEIEGHRTEEIYPEEAAKNLGDDLEVLRSRKPRTGVVESVRGADGNLLWTQTDKVPYRDDQGNDLGILVFTQDVTERKRAESRIELQHAVTRVLAEALPLAETTRKILEIVCQTMEWQLGDFWTMDRAARQLRCVEVWHLPSTEFLEFAAVSRGISFKEEEGLPGQVWATREPRWIADITKDPTFARRAVAQRLGLHSGIGFPIKLREKVFGVMGFYSMHTQEPDPEIMALFAALGTQIGQFIERQQLEDQYRQSQKMEAVGTLAGGIAHDFNNILAAINGYAQLAKMESGANRTVNDYLDAVLAGARRAADLVRQIMAFTRQQENLRSPIQLRHIAAEAVKLLRATIPTTIEISTLFARDLPPVLADATQVHQVIMNLCTNAWHAMKDRPGKLGVELERFEVDAGLARTQPDLRPGSYVRLSVSDTGHGMAKATLDRIFEPFFTTKAPGEGTGLGLAVVHGIMRTHDGAITVYSEPGQGTKFHLYFPAHLGPRVADAGVKAPPVPHGKGERVLYLDDEKLLAEMGGKILQRLGYKPEIFSTAADALAAFRAQPEKFDLVATDMTMPVM
ncbi:MAG: ATP-binding protein, partial [Opitutaceae bacterium]